MGILAAHVYQYVGKYSVSLIPCAVQIVVAGVAYIFGGNKEKLRQFALEQRAENISKTKGAKKH